MDLLKNQKGETIIEVMVGIIILGLITGFALIFFTKMLSNTKLVSKNEALFLANQEINYSMKNRVKIDTSYFSPDSTMLVERKVEKVNKLYNVEVMVKLNSDKKSLVELKTRYAEEN